MTKKVDTVESPSFKEGDSVKILLPFTTTVLGTSLGTIVEVRTPRSIVVQPKGKSNKLVFKPEELKKI